MARRFRPASGLSSPISASKLKRRLYRQLHSRMTLTSWKAGNSRSEKLKKEHLQVLTTAQTVYQSFWLFCSTPLTSFNWAAVMDPDVSVT